MTTPTYDLETRAHWRAWRRASDAYAAALAVIPPFDDVATTDDAPLNPASLVKAGRVRGVGGTGDRM